MSNLSSADAAAIQDLQTPPSAATPVETPPAQAPSETPNVETPPPAEPTEDPYEKRYKDLQREFTKRNQHAAQVEARLGQFENWYQQYVNWAQQQQQQRPDPDAVATNQAVEETVEAKLTAKEKELERKFEQKIAAAEIQRYEREYSEQVGKYAEELVKSEPLLQHEIEDAEDTSFFELMVKHAQKNMFGPKADPDAPRNINVFKKHMKDYAEKRTAKLKKLAENHRQAGLAEAVKANKPSIASPGGSTPSNNTATKVPKWGSKDFQEYLKQGVIEEQAALKK